MTKPAGIVLMIVTGILSSIGLKMVWDDYQMKRAMKQIPVVVSLLDEIRDFPSSSRIESDYGGPSANEYSAVIWRYHRADSKCSDVQGHFQAEALRTGFAFDSIGHQNGGTQLYHRKGEYEMRVLFEPQDSVTCRYAVSVNWSPSDWID